MTIALCYIAVTHGKVTADFASRFVSSYMQFPPGVGHETFICCNGGPLSHELACMFLPLNPKFFPRENDPGYDISAYISAAAGPCKDFDMMVCLGESNYFHKEGWMKRLAEVWTKFGPGMYGPYSSNAVRAHLNTTAFCCPPLLLAQYPVRVGSRADRYEFEHGEQSLWRRIAKRGMPVRLVTWDGEWLPRQWRLPSNILWRGNQTNCLMWCNHSDRYGEAPQKTREGWMRSCDRPFR